MDDGRAIVGIGQGIDQAAVPIEVVCGHVLRHIRQVFGQAGHLGIHRQHRVEAGRAEADPLNALGLFRHPIANLANGHHTGAVNANGPVNALSGVLCLGIGVIGCTLIVGRENVLHILHRHLALRHKGPGDVVTVGRKIRMLPFPAVAGGTEHLSHKPGPGGIVNMVGIRVGAEAVPGIEHAIVTGVQVVLRNEGLQIPGAQVFPALAKGIRKIKPIQSELVGHNDAFVVRHPAGNPVVTADGLHPPDLFVIVEGNAIGLISTVLLQELSQPHNALPGRMDIGQHQNHQVLLADSPRDILLPAALGLPVLHHRVRPQNSGIGRDGLRGGHAHVGLVDARCGPNTLGPVHIGAGGIAHGVLRQLDGQMADDAFVCAGLLFRVHRHQLFHVKVTVIRSGDHGRAVIAGVSAYKNGCAGHSLLSFVFIFLHYSTLPKGKPAFLFHPGQITLRMLYVLQLHFMKIPPIPGYPELGVHITNRGLWQDQTVSTLMVLVFPVLPLMGPPVRTTQSPLWRCMYFLAFSRP